MDPSGALATCPYITVPAPAPKAGACVSTPRDSGRGSKEDPACCILGRCPRGQGHLRSLRGRIISTHRSTTLLEAFPRVVVPRREEEIGCCNPVQTSLDDRLQGTKVTSLRARFGVGHALPPHSPRPCPRPPWCEIPPCGAVQPQSRAGGGWSAQRSLQPGCWGALMGCGRRGFGPLRLRRERNPSLPLPQHIL